MKYYAILIERFLRTIFGKNELNYINGADTLPPPLSKDEEKEVMTRLAAGR